ncbi:MAG TPA: methyltransferase domain-containing protein [Anaerolineales bacterium]|nr:methyltransferase domain-containing protein [Anaerolineales bacterium]
MNRFTDYDSIARTYDQRYERNPYAGVEQALKEFIGDHPELRILEVGCGTGHWLGILRGRGLHVTGLDFSTEMLAQAQASLPSSELTRGRAEHLPYASGSFDRVFCINALHHFADKPAFLAEARHVLRPGGRLLSVGLDPHSGVDQWYVYDYFKESLEIDRQRYPSSNSLRELMSSVGFEKVVTQEVQRWTVRLPAQAILEQGRLDKTATSQLSVLTDPEYQRGMQLIRADIRRAEEKGETLFLTSDLRLYGTSGSIAEPQG